MDTSLTTAKQNNPPLKKIKKANMDTILGIINEVTQTANSFKSSGYLYSSYLTKIIIKIDHIKV